MPEQCCIYCKKEMDVNNYGMASHRQFCAQYHEFIGKPFKKRSCNLVKAGKESRSLGGKTSARINREKKLNGRDLKTYYLEEVLVEKDLTFKQKGVVLKTALIESGIIENDHCKRCGWAEKSDPENEFSQTQPHHIDGNPFNNKPENIEILCPNCHSLTPNYRAKNKSSCRK